MNDKWIKRLNELSKQAKEEMDDIPTHIKVQILKASERVYTLIGYSQTGVYEERKD